MSNIKAKVMRRVYMTTYIRRVISPFAIKCYASLVALLAFSRLVWVSRVVENAPNLTRHPLDTANFFIHAFTGTEVAVQVIVVALTIVGVWLIRDLFKARQKSSELNPFLSRAI